MVVNEFDVQDLIKEMFEDIEFNLNGKNTSPEEI